MRSAVADAQAASAERDHNGDPLGGKILRRSGHAEEHGRHGGEGEDQNAPWLRGDSSWGPGQ
jgi:hypothetical protein